VSTEERDGKCLVCGVAVRARRRWSQVHGTFWHPVAHNAPCGAPCIGGGTRYSALDIEGTHRTTECSALDCDGGVPVEVPHG
jgi:hypothetical protein